MNNDQKNELFKILEEASNDELLVIEKYISLRVRIYEIESGEKMGSQDDLDQSRRNLKRDIRDIQADFIKPVFGDLEIGDDFKAARGEYVKVVFFANPSYHMNCIRLDGDGRGSSAFFHDDYPVELIKE